MLDIHHKILLQKHLAVFPEPSLRILSKLLSGIKLLAGCSSALYHHGIRMIVLTDIPRKGDTGLRRQLPNGFHVGLRPERMGMQVSRFTAHQLYKAVILRPDLPLYFLTREHLFSAFLRLPSGIMDANVGTNIVSALIHEAGNQFGIADAGPGNQIKIHPKTGLGMCRDQRCRMNRLRHVDKHPRIP